MNLPTFFTSVAFPLVQAIITSHSDDCNNFLTDALTSFLAHLKNTFKLNVIACHISAQTCRGVHILLGIGTKALTMIPKFLPCAACHYCFDRTSYYCTCHSTPAPPVFQQLTTPPPQTLHTGCSHCLSPLSLEIYVAVLLTSSDSCGPLCLQVFAFI